MTQAQLAEKVAVQPETISRIETGGRTASLDLIAQLSEALGLELHELFRLRDKSNPKDHAIEKLLWFATRLTAAEIELVIDVSAPVLEFARRSGEA